MYSSPCPLCHKEGGKYIYVYQLFSPSLRSREGEDLNGVKEGGEYVNSYNCILSI